MTLEELSDALGGFGRSQLAWDCYSKGVDPHYLFRMPSTPSSPSQPSHQQEDNHDHQEDKSELLSSPLHQYFRNEYSYNNIESLKKQILPTPRQSQTLGTSALNLLSSTIHSHCNGCIENGLATLVHISPSTDGTTKLLLRFMDGWEVETVLIPFWSNDNNKQSVEEGRNGADKQRSKTTAATTGRTTVCISSQVGCRQGCTFCATGKMGKLRSLTTDEILVQFFFAQKIVRLSNTNNNNKLHKDDGGAMIPLPPITNVVFMGMGEPADNAPSVRGAIDILTRNELFQLSASRVTVSTVAPCPDSFLEFVDSKCGKCESS
jgi:adenine C2-methylase RlmN of 23S rRNA A2503 and tRNA A37